MSRRATDGRPELPLRVLDEPITAHLSLDPGWDCLTVIEFGSVWDGQPDDHFGALAEDERLRFLFRGSGGPVIGFMVHEPHQFEPEVLDSPELWEGPRFNVPVLGLTNATIGEVVLATTGRFPEGEPTTDAAFFHMAIDAAHAQNDLQLAEGYWRMALEAGDMKAHFGLGYTLVDLNRHREAYRHLRIYTELTPHNSWAWFWFGRACEGLGEQSEAINAYLRAVELEEVGGFETDANERLAQLLAS